MNTTFGRRSFMQHALFLVGCATGLPVIGRNLANAGFGSAQGALLDLVADTIIPPTDTPGAHGVGVRAFMEEMLTYWAAPATVLAFRRELGAIDALAVKDCGASFGRLDAFQRLQVARSYDAFHIGEEGGAYARLKGMILLGYYLSEIGATQELRYELVPGAWHGCIPLGDVGRCWAV